MSSPGVGWVGKQQVHISLFVGNRLSRKTMEICTKEVESRQAAPRAVAVKSQSACESQLQPFLYQVLKGGQQAKLKLQLNRRDINLYYTPFKACKRFNLFFVFRKKFHFMRSIRFLNF